MKTKTKNKTRASGMVQQVEIFANEYKNVSSITRAQRAGESRVSAGCVPTFIHELCHAFPSKSI